jgi:hypothetical protein
VNSFALALLLSLARAQDEQPQKRSKAEGRFVPGSVPIEQVTTPGYEKAPDAPATGPSILDQPPLDETRLPMELEDAVHRHLGRFSEEPGYFEVADPKLKKKWKLKLLQIHSGNLVVLTDEKAFSCAEFREKGGKRVLDLDFYVKRVGDRWKVEKVYIHRVAGQPRYEYNEGNERVPVK